MMKKIFILWVLMFFGLFGCSGVRVVRPSQVNIHSINRIALIQVKLAERSFAPLPVLDSAIFKNYALSMIDKYEEIDKKVAEDMTLFYQKKIAEYTKKEIVVVPNPFSDLEFSSYKSVGPDKGEGYGDQKVIREIIKIAQENNVQLVVYLVARVNTRDARLFGAFAGNEVESVLTVFDENGNVKGQSYFVTDLKVFGPRDLKSYKNLLYYSYSSYGEDLVELAFKNKK